MKTAELAGALSWALDEELRDVIALLASAADPTDVEIVADDDPPEEIVAGCWVVDSRRTLCLDGHDIATWTRASIGGWTRDRWIVDSTLDDDIPPMVAYLLSLWGLSDYPPDVPAPSSASETTTEDPDGAYGVYWTTPDGATLCHQYASLQEAEEVAESLMRDFRRANPSRDGYLCRYEVGEIAD